MSFFSGSSFYQAEVAGCLLSSSCMVLLTEPHAIQATCYWPSADACAVPRAQIYGIIVTVIGAIGGMVRLLRLLADTLCSLWLLRLTLVCCACCSGVSSRQVHTVLLPHCTA